MKLDDNILCNIFGTHGTAELKTLIRRDCMYLRSSMAPEERISADAIINHIILSHFDLSAYSCVCAYVSDGSEVDVAPVMRHCLESGIPLALPRFKSRGEYDFVIARDLDFVPGRYSIPEPPADSEPAGVNLLENAFFIVPGVAFDAERCRLGRGAGVYDRVLSKYGKYSVGVFYECQKCRTIPVDAHDRALDAVVTERTFLRGLK